MPEDGGTTATIVLMNKGSYSCKLGGFPGVDLTSINGGERWSLARSSQKWSSLEVEASQSTEFTLNLAFTKEAEGFYQLGLGRDHPAQRDQGPQESFPKGARSRTRGWCAQNGTGAGWGSSEPAEPAWVSDVEGRCRQFRDS
ncbi:hypothetical protein ACFQ10_32650 [Streptomyces indonesiensis]